MVDSFLTIVLYTIPLFITNASCTLAVLLKKRHPIDFGAKLKDERLLGDGKTFEGSAIGFFSGLAASLLISFFFSGFNFILSISANGISIIGGFIASFIKRRLHKKSGAKLEIVDQLDFVVASYIFLSFYIAMDALSVAVMLVVTYFLHKLTNILAYKMKLKKVPW